MLVDGLHQNRLQLILAKLYYNEKGTGVLSDALREKQQAAAAMNSKLVDGEQIVKTIKKERGRLTREQLHMEKELRCVDIGFRCETVYLHFTFGNKHHDLKIITLKNILHVLTSEVELMEQ